MDHVITLKIVLLVNIVSGKDIDQSLLAALSASLNSFCSSLLADQVRQLVTQKSRVMFKTFGDVHDI